MQVFAKYNLQILLLLALLLVLNVKARPEDDDHFPKNEAIDIQIHATPKRLNTTMAASVRDILSKKSNKT